jgi:hypothetical protein
MKAIIARYRLGPLAAFTVRMGLILVAVTLIVTGSAAATAAAGNTNNSAQDNLSGLRAATARYHSLPQAKANGYALFVDQNNIACIDNPGVGAMGIHYLSGDVLGAVTKSGQFDPTKPQALVYEPGTDGQMSLVAVEFLVFQKDWETVHGANAAPPTLFGQDFMLIPAGNRFSPDAIYALHVWVWQDNPDGTFAMWNPNVSCTPAHGRTPLPPVK